jgi:hypothetical protein
MHNLDPWRKLTKAIVPAEKKRIIQGSPGKGISKDLVFSKKGT